MGASHVHPDDPSATAIPNCLCMGDAHHYKDAYVPKESFAHDFLSNQWCSPQLTLNDCSMILQAGGTIDVRDSALKNACGTYDLQPVAPLPSGGGGVAMPSSSSPLDTGDAPERPRPSEPQKDDSGVVSASSPVWYAVAGAVGAMAVMALANRR